MRNLVKNFAIVFAVALLIQTARAQDAPKALSVLH